MPERIYMYLPKNGKDITKEEIEKFKLKILDKDQIKKRGYSVIRFDFYRYMTDHKHPYTLYNDTGMNEEEAAYGLIPIPSKYLKEIK